MTRAIPARSNDADATAREAAHRAGVPLNEWLVPEPPEASLAATETDVAARIKALNARLSRPPATEPYPVRPHPRSRPGRDRDVWRGRAGSCEKGLVASGEERLSAPGETAQTSNPGAPAEDSPLPNAIAGQLTEIERRLRHGEGDGQPVRVALARLEQDLSEFQTANGSASQNERLRPLESHLNDLLEALRASPLRPTSSTQLRFDIARAAMTHEPATTESNCGAAPATGVSEAQAAPPDRNLTAIAEELGTVMGWTGETISGRPIAMKSEASESAAAEIASLRRQISELTQAIGDFSPNVAIQALDQAVRQLTDKIDTATDPRLRDALIAPVTTIASDVREMLRSADARTLFDHLDREVKAIAGKIGHFFAEFEPKTSGQLREVREGLTTLAAKPMPFDKIEHQLVALAERVERLAIEGASKASVRQVMTALVEVNRQLTTQAPSATLKLIEQRLTTLANRIDQIASATPHHKIIEILSRRIDAAQQSLTTRIDGWRPAPVDLKGVENALASLAKRLDVSAETAAHNVAILVAQIAKIASQVDHLACEAAPRTSAAELAASLEEVRRLVEATVPADKVHDLSKRIDALARSVEEVLAAAPAVAQNYEGLTRRIAAVHHSLAARLDSPPPQKIETNALESMVRELAARLDTPRPIEAESSSLDSLQAQVARIADKLERSDDGLVTLASLQSSILDLFNQLQETRHAALDAAETAARTAARDTLREVMLAPPAGPDRPSAEEKQRSEQISRQLTEIRAVQDHADRRVHSTLSAVHGTLERIAQYLPRVAGRPADLSGPRGPTRGPDRPTAAPSENTSNPSNFDSALGILAKAIERQGAADGPSASSLAPIEPSSSDDFLIEPGAAQGLSQKPEIARSSSGQASFIAAARRAAQAAAESVAQMAHPETMPSQGKHGLAARLRAWFFRSNKHLLAGLAALALLAAAVLVDQTLYGNLVGGDPASAVAAKISDAETSPGTAGHSGMDSSSDINGANAQTPAPKDSATASAAAGATLSPIAPTLISSAARPPDVVPSAPFTALSSSPPSGLGEVAQAGNPAAQYELGVRFADVGEVGRDYKTAALWFEKAATQGLAPAQFRLGTLYEKGLGVSRDEGIAKLWYQRAAERGNVRAMHNLAVLTAEGGTKPDYATAATWFRKAAELGVRDSQYNLAILYARGMGLEQSLSQSYLWFSLAAAQGDEDAAKKRDEVAARLDVKALDAAKMLVSQFQPGVPDPSANEVVLPPAGWDGSSARTEPKPAVRPTAKPKVSRL
jgi:localization factor PodJL